MQVCLHLRALEHPNPGPRSAAASWAINNLDTRASLEARLTHLADQLFQLDSALRTCSSLDISAVVTDQRFNKNFMKEVLPRELRLLGPLADRERKSSDVVGTLSFGLVKVAPTVDSLGQEGDRERRLLLTRVVREATPRAYLTSARKSGSPPDTTRPELQDGRE